MKTISKTIRIDEDVSNTIRDNQMELQEDLNLPNMGALYSYFLRMGLERYLKEGNILTLPVLYEYKPMPHSEQTDPSEETTDEIIEPETRITDEQFKTLLKEGLYADLTMLNSFYSLANVRILSLFNNKIESIMGNHTIEMLDFESIYNIGQFISTFVRRFAYLLYLYYPSQLELVQWDILLKTSDLHPFLFIINETHYIEKDDIQTHLIKNLFQTYKDLELDIRLEISEEKGGF